ncbi:hypothetical protein SAMN05421831_10377 [Allopseudospirillum japonicum]|uniref:Proteolipid membrane potential modulator n=1 Tax=Allopseudospirillum japonicum TaxID=64971 RepID=A0A1H6R4L4_9GAMM|nr:hypothetical protein SAMN05421831_10377 [Allopseudospirillum japonicum]
MTIKKHLVLYFLFAWILPPVAMLLLIRYNMFHTWVWFLMILYIPGTIFYFFWYIFPGRTPKEYLQDESST